MRFLPRLQYPHTPYCHRGRGRGSSSNGWPSAFPAIVRHTASHNATQGSTITAQRRTVYRRKETGEGDVRHTDSFSENPHRHWGFRKHSCRFRTFVRQMGYDSPVFNHAERTKGDHMTDVAPVRAWAEWQECTGYLESRGEGVTWSGVVIPTTDLGHMQTGLATGVTDWVRKVTQAGPLRSLRVLLSNGSEVHIDRVSEWRQWTWRIDEAIGQNLWADTDAEAVERALAEAIAWFASAATTAE